MTPLTNTDNGSERLSADDMATRREGEFLQAALATQAARAGASAAAPAGLCANCGQRCHPCARYCDPDCRADHEQRLRALRRQGRAG